MYDDVGDESQPAAREFPRPISYITYGRSEIIITYSVLVARVTE